MSLDEFHFAVNHVEPSLIRVQADEVTYNLHILIRFELEQALISGDLRPADLPAAWNEAYRRHLGIVPANDAEGCLQDGHWAAGHVRLFSDLHARQPVRRPAVRAGRGGLGGLDEAFARGDFAPLLDWLREKVYRHGGRYPAARLIEQATGSPPDPRPLVAALRRKYGELYGIA